MKSISRSILVGALALILLSSACGSLTEATPTSIGTILPQDLTQTSMPTSTVTSVTATEVSITPLIPITGENVVSMQCQFCVEGETHAVLVFPDFAFFDVVSSSPTSCFTADVVNGRRILICRGAQQTTFTLNVCSDSTDCLQFSVALQACPLLQDDTPQATFTPFAPFFLTPINTLNPTDSDQDPTQPASTAAPSLTPTTGSIPATPTSPPPATTTGPPPATATSVPSTEPPPPTEEPPTSEPEPTAEPTDSNENTG